jgi:hypothetical protein
MTFTSLVVVEDCTDCGICVDDPAFERAQYIRGLSTFWRTMTDFLELGEEIVSAREKPLGVSARQRERLPVLVVSMHEGIAVRRSCPARGVRG